MLVANRLLPAGAVVPWKLLFSLFPGVVRPFKSSASTLWDRFPDIAWRQVRGFESHHMDRFLHPPRFFEAVLFCGPRNHWDNQSAL